PAVRGEQSEDRAAGRRGAGAPAVRGEQSEDRAAGHRGAGAPPSEASNLKTEPQDVAGLGPPPSEASDLKDRAAGRRGAGAPAVRDEHGRGGARTELGQTRDVSFRGGEDRLGGCPRPGPKGGRPPRTSARLEPGSMDSVEKAARAVRLITAAPRSARPDRASA